MRAFHFLIAIALYACTLGVAIAAEAPKRGEITGGVAHAPPGWFKESFLEIAEDVDEATEEGKHVLLFFQLNGCPYCDRMLTEAFETDPLMSYIQENFDVIAINVRGDRDIAFNEETSTTEKELSEMLKVRATPGIIFLSAENKPVVRVDGYRSPERFRHILSYVVEKAYETQTLSAYLEQHLDEEVYSLKPNPLFKELSDLSAVSGPLAVILEDSSCHDCAEFHERTLADPAVIEELKPFIDRNYRTRPGRDDTFLMGSSMGGIISLYGVIRFPDVFGGAACVSTHWPSTMMPDNPEGNAPFLDFLRGSIPAPGAHRIYFDFGTAELDAQYEPHQQQVDAVMRELGYEPGLLWQTRRFEGAGHNEGAWSARVHIPLTFLLGKNNNKE